MKNNRIKMELIAFLNNVVALGCFTVLALVFDKWWIVFFSILFYVRVTVKEEKKK